ncbi:hypothetical protein T484DRAFT_1798169 [Baffinella frigidus]|nr:hypothetical protein T484DRAFT_1798169 [Cryptophyta sp. CCMP2293]
MGNAASGCCQTQGDTSDGPPPPWLVQSSSDELGAAIDRKFSLGRDGEAGGERRVDVGCQAGFVETFHHGGGTLLLHFGDAAAGEAPDELLDVGDANDAEGGFAEMKRAREQDTGADADNHLVLELDMVPQATVVGAGGCLSLRTSLPLAAVRAAYRVSDFRALDSSFATTLIRDASLAYGAPQAYGAHQPRGRDFAAQACTSGSRNLRGSPSEEDPLPVA